MFPSPLPSQKNVYDEWNGKHGYNIAPAVHGEHTKNVYWTPIRRVHLSDDVEFFFCFSILYSNAYINKYLFADRHPFFFSFPILLFLTYPSETKRARFDSFCCMCAKSSHCTHNWFSLWITPFYSTHCKHYAHTESWHSRDRYR